MTFSISIPPIRSLFSGQQARRLNENTAFQNDKQTISLKGWSERFQDLPDGLKEEIIPRKTLIKDMLEIRQPATAEEKQWQVLQYKLLKAHTSDPKNKNNHYLQESMRKGNWLLFHTLLKTAESFDPAPLLQGAIIAGNDKAFVKVLEKTRTPVPPDMIRLIAEHGQPEKLEQVIAKRLTDGMEQTELDQWRALAKSQEQKIRQCQHLTQRQWKKQLYKIADRPSVGNEDPIRRNRLNLIALAHTPNMPVNEPFDEDSGETILHLAARLGSASVVQRLLYHQPDLRVNQRENTRLTALHLAAREDQPDVLRSLLKVRGIHVNPKNREKFTPLCLAAINGNTSAVRVLVTKPDCDVNNIIPVLQLTPLHWAAVGNHTDIIRTLLGRADLRVNHGNVFNATALHLALKHKHIEAAKALLSDPRTDVNHKDWKGQTPLHRAVRKTELVPVLEKLLQRPDIQVNLPDGRGQTPLRVARQNGQDPQIIALLLDHGAQE